MASTKKIKLNLSVPTSRKCGFRDATAVSINLHDDFLCSDDYLRCVADVGGGYVRNDERFCLARIPLRWMIRECFATNTGIQFHSVQLKQMGLNPTSLYHKLIPRPPAIFDNKQEADPHLQNYARPWPGNTTLRLEGHAVRHLFRWLRRLGANERAPSSTRDSPEHPFVSEEHEDLSDALSDMHDQLQARRFWWILELLPQQQQYQKDDDMCGTTVTYVTKPRVSIVLSRLLVLTLVVLTAHQDAHGPGTSRAETGRSGEVAQVGGYPEEGKPKIPSQGEPQVVQYEAQMDRLRRARHWDPLSYTHMSCIHQHTQFFLTHLQSYFCAPSPLYHSPYQYPLSHSHFLSFISENPQSDCMVQLAPVRGGPFSSTFPREPVPHVLCNSVNRQPALRRPGTDRSNIYRTGTTSHA